MINDSTQRADAINGLEYISNVVCRYVQIEQVYFQSEELTLRNDLEKAIMKLYTQILEYQARAARHFNRNTGHQAGRNIVEADGWASILESIKESEEECDKFREIIDASDQRHNHSKKEWDRNRMLRRKSKQSEKTIILHRQNSLLFRWRYYARSGLINPPIYFIATGRHKVDNKLLLHGCDVLEQAEYILMLKLHAVRLIYRGVNRDNNAKVT